MSIPSASHLFKAGLGNPSSQSDYLDTIVQKEIELASRDVEMRTPPPSSPHAEDLVSELGEYFARTATMWAQLTQQLIKGPHITEASYQAHERSRRQSHMSDLAEVATIDYNLSKLKYVHTCWISPGTTCSLPMVVVAKVTVMQCRPSATPRRLETKRAPRGELWSFFFLVFLAINTCLGKLAT